MNQDTIAFRVMRAVVLGLLCLYVLFPLYIAFVTSATPFDALSTSLARFPRNRP